MDKFDRLINVVNTLRSPGGCPWDKKQSAESLIPYMVEELYEVIEAIDEQNQDHLKKELGDLFLHLVFQGILAEEKGWFTISDSLESISDKLIFRHPHVFGNETIADDADLNRVWETQKQKEGRKYILDGIPKQLPGLHRAYRIQSKASAAGFDWDNIEDVWRKVHEEVDELEEASGTLDKSKIEEEFGDLLFSLVNVSRHLGINADEALRKANNKFIHRFNQVEDHFKESKLSIREASLAKMDEVWDTIKHK